MLSEAARNRMVYPGLLVLTTVTGVIGSLGAPLVPQVAAEEGVTLNAAQWSLTSTLLVGAVVTPVIGRIGVGRRRRPVMLGCLAGVALGTLLAALPLGFGALVAGRGLQGLGFGITPLAIAVARDTMPAGRARAALAAISVANVASAGLGFPAAALIADLFGVKGAFWAAFVVTAGAIVVGVVAVPRSAEHADGPVDWCGAVLLGASTLCVLLAISRADQWGYASPRVLGLLAAAAALLLACVRRLLRVRHPLVDLRTAVRPGVLGANLAGLLAGIGMYMMMATVMVLVQAGSGSGYGLDKSVAVAGLMLTPYAVSSVLGNRVALWLGPRIGPDLLLPLGCLGFGLANLALVFWHAEVWQIVLVMTLGGIGSGATFNSIPWLMVRVVPSAETGSAIGFNLVMRFVGFSLGSALSVAVLQHFADSAHRPTEWGFEVAAVTGLGVSLLAAVGCLVLARSAGAQLTAEEPA